MASISQPDNSCEGAIAKPAGHNLRQRGREGGRIDSVFGRRSYVTQARERLYEAAAAGGVTDLLAVTGDTHVFWQNRLFDKDNRSMGLELGTSGITSPRGFSQLGAAATQRFDELTAERNDSVDWVDGGHRGYIKLTLEHAQATAQFVALSNIETRRFTTDVLRTVKIVRDTIKYT